MIRKEEAHFSRAPNKRGPCADNMTTKRALAKKIFVIIKFGILLLLIIGIPAYLYFFHHEVITSFESLEDVEIFLEKYEIASVFIYLGCQVVQIVISIIPGQALQFAAGYIYGFWLGFLLSIIGIALGTISTFGLARILGKDALYLIFGEKRFSKFVDRLNSKRAFIAIFFIYLIPGLPKDLVGYAAGISKMKLWPFLILSLIARTPALMISLMVGLMANQGSYTGVIVLSIIAAILCVLGLIYRKRLMAFIDKEYELFSR